MARRRGIYADSTNVFIYIKHINLQNRKEMIQLEIATKVYKSLHGLAPECCTVYTVHACFAMVSLHKSFCKELEVLFSKLV